MSRQRRVTRPPSPRSGRRVPSVLAGRYEVVRRVGVGGMADVYLADDTKMGRQVALKILHPQYAGDDSFIERFRREALAAARLQHPNIVQIYDSGQQGDFNFIVMEYVEGRSLKDYLADEGPLEVAEASRIAREVLTALAYAHRTGLVHRDIKPGNILLSEDGKVQVTDFGIARAEAGSTMTQTGTILGTAYYLSPEQAQGLQLDGRSDIYSLGVVFYEMLTGRRPFEGESPVSIAYKHVREMPRPPSTHRGDLPRSLEAIVMTAMAKRPEDRYSSAALMRRDLEAFASGREVTATLRVAAVEDSTQVLRAVGRMDRQAARRPGWLVALALALLVGGLALLTWSIVTLSSTVLGRVDVPKVVEREPDAANRILRSQGLEPSFQRGEFSAQIAEGLITRQEPPTGRRVARGSQVKYWVSLGRTIVEVPRLVGMKIEDAARALDREGLRLGQRTGVFSTEEPGTVLSQDPGPGREARAEDRVDVTVSQGEERAIVPNVIGRDEADASAILANAGFRVNRIRESHPSVARGVVFDQDPPPTQEDGTPTEAPAGSVVDIFVSEGPDEFPMPDVRGESEEDATEELQDLGLRVRVVRQFDPGNEGIVVSQEPAPGTRVNRGQTVEIRVGDS
ncbi:MAG: Stk1 family PASTA domain-containing Ser/Thr kinase [Actinomycetota bacterium]